MLSRSQIFEKVQAVTESMDSVCAKMEYASSALRKIGKIDKELKSVSDVMHDGLQKLKSMRSVLRKMRGNALWDFEQRTETGNSEMKKTSVTVGDRMLALIKDDPKFKPYKKPRKDPAGGYIIGRIGNLKVVYRGKIRQ